MIKLWLDDIRTPPDETWLWCKNGYECVGMIVANAGNIDIVSFDHDLGEGVNGYWVACQIETMANNFYRHSLVEFKDNPEGICVPSFDWEVHSANPVGRKNIEWAMKSAERFWNK